jgi:hypothetical protein
MGSLPPSVAREFEELIMVPRGGIEYMAGGTGSHPMIGMRVLVDDSNSNTKSKSPGEEEKQNLTPAPMCA